MAGPLSLFDAIPPAAAASLQIQVNYAEEWIAGDTDPGAAVVAEVRSGDGELKAEGQVDADPSGHFFVACSDWHSGACPDIRPGDRVVVRSDSGAESEINPVGSVEGFLDAADNTVDATLNVDGFPGPLDVRCEVWSTPGPLPIDMTADPLGGNFTCDFDDVGWTLERGQAVALSYFELDGDSVVNNPGWPSMRVNYAHDRVGGDYPAGHPITVTVMDDFEHPKAEAHVVSDHGAGWWGSGFEVGASRWVPAPPDIVPNDRVVFHGLDHGYNNQVTVGAITGTLEIASDTISGTITQIPFSGALDVECHPWGAWESGLGDAPVKGFPNGSAPYTYTCAWNPGTEWDVVPGQDVAVMYIEPDDGDRVINVFRGPAPHLRLSKTVHGAPGEDGNLAFTIRYENVGDAPAEGVSITENMQVWVGGNAVPGGMHYLSDTSGLPHSGAASGPIVWDVGAVDPEQAVEFELFVEVMGTAEDVVRSTAQISTPTPYDQGDPWEKSAVWEGTVLANDTHLDVAKTAWTDDPAADGAVVFSMTVCNRGPTGSTKLTLTDRPDTGLTLDSWGARRPGWTVESFGSDVLIVTTPTVPGHSCREVWVRATVDAGLAPGDPLRNPVGIEASNDLDAEDNQATWEGVVGARRFNLWVDKVWNRGHLVPGGELRYGIAYGNSGNTAVDTVRIVDALPEGTIYLGNWHQDPYGGGELAPLLVDPEKVVWELTDLLNGSVGEMELRLRVDPLTPADTALVNRVEVCGPSGPPEPCAPLPGEDTYADNEATWAETINPPGPNLRVQKWEDWVGDERLDYRVNFENVGDTYVPAVSITDTVPLETAWSGEWGMDFPEERLLDWGFIPPRTLLWILDGLAPGESGWLHFSADLDLPGEPLQWYTNRIDITLPDGDTNPDDNSYESTAFSGGEVKRVEFLLHPNGTCEIRGEAVPGPVTVETTLGDWEATPNPACGGCWSIDGTVLLGPGDTVRVVAGAGIQPVLVTIPDPLEAGVDSTTDEVFGQIGGWLSRPVAVHGDWPAGVREVTSDGAGNFLASYPDIPRGGAGLVQVADEVDYALVLFQRPFRDRELVLDINYADDAVAGRYEPGHTVELFVTESDGETVKGIAYVATTLLPEGGGASGFSTVRDGWQGDVPDIRPGDWVFGSVDGDYETATFRNAVQVGGIDFAPDYGGDTVAGTLWADWLVHPVVLLCEVPGYPGSPVVEAPVDPETGAFACDFVPTGWDLGPPQPVAVGYREPDQDRVSNIVYWPRMVAHTGPDSGGSRRVSGEHAGANAIVVVQVSTDLGEFVAETETLADRYGSFDTGDALPEEALSLWYEVETDFGNGITDTLTVYPMSGVANPATDEVEVSAAGEPFFTLALVYCAPDAECELVDLGEIGPSGVVTVDLMEARGFDIRPGARFAAYLTAYNGHVVSYAWSLPAPELEISKWFTGGYARPGGVLTYGLSCRNNGNGPAENVFIDDILPAYTTYAGDTAGIAPDLAQAGVASWSLGTIDAGEERAFTVTLSVAEDAPAGSGVMDPNCAAVSTTSVGDWRPDNDGSCTGPVDVWEDDVDVGVDKWAVPADPAPGQEFDYVVRWCNNRGAGAGPATLTDVLPPGTTLLAWRPDDRGQAFWNEEPAALGELVLSAPGLPGNTCGNLNLRLLLDPGTEIGATLINTVGLDASGDVNPSDNWVAHTTQVGAVRHDLAVDKVFGRGLLVPGGWAEFLLRYENKGNVATEPRVTDTLPPGLGYVGAWWGAGSPYPGTPLPIPTVIGNQLVWDVPELAVARGTEILARFSIDDMVVPGPEVLNCVAVESTAEDANPGDNENCAVFPINPTGPNLRVGKWSAWQGEDRLRYTVRFENIGSDSVTGVEIVDTLPAGVSWNEVWELGFEPGRIIGDVSHQDGVLTWIFDELRPGETGELVFDTSLDQPPAPLQWFLNRVEITVPAGEVRPGDNFDDDVTFWANRCSGDQVILFEAVYGDEFLCGARESITVRSVTVTASGRVTLRAPSVALGGEFAVARGGMFGAGAP